MGYGECGVNELKIREQCFLKSCLKWFITKKCIICLSTWRREQPFIEQIGLRTYIQYTHWQKMTVNMNDIGKNLGNPQCCPSFLFNTTMQWHSDTPTVWVFALLFCWIGKSIKGLKSYSHFALWWVPDLLQRVDHIVRKKTFNLERRESVLSLSKQSKYALHKLEQSKVCYYCDKIHWLSMYLYKDLLKIIQY